MGQLAMSARMAQAWSLEAAVVTFLIVFGVVYIAPNILSGVKVRSGTAAAMVALTFAALNVLLGWLIILGVGLVLETVSMFTFGLGDVLYVVFGAFVNMILLWIIDTLMDGFDIDGWGSTFLLGVLIQAAHWLVVALLFLMLGWSL
ncbi:MAG: phage holin family protein [Anaerolineae bacterium]|jgi:uncharacterized membrane protein YvlD (DUF360 family)